MRVVRESQEWRAEFERELEDDKLTDEDVDRLKAYVSGHARTEEWLKVIGKIAAGELTWRAVAEDVGRTDPDVAAAFRSLARVPPATEETLIEIGYLPAKPPEGEAAGQEDEPGREERQPRPSGVLKLGAPADREEDTRAGEAGPPVTPPRRRRPPPGPGDEDLSERTWLR